MQWNLLHQRCWSNMVRHRIVPKLCAMLIATGILWGAICRPLNADELLAVKPTTRLLAPEIKDQDDMCVWVDPSQPERSTVIASDKTAGAIFVYDLQGQLLQQIAVNKPGNIDVRQGVKLGERVLDLVVVNQRGGGFKLRVFGVDRQTRRLEPLDNGDLVTGPNYGGCLYHSAKTGKLFFVCTSDAGTVEQYELQAIADGKIGGKKVRAWPVGKCEGAVADDEEAVVYIAEEKKGVWRFPAEPEEPATGTLIVKVGEHGLKGDVEGLCVYRGSDRSGYLLVSDQGSNRFSLYDRRPPHGFIGHFSIEGAEDSDGIDLSIADFGSGFPKGFFACHTGRVPRAVLITPWQDIASQLPIKASVSSTSP